MSAFLDFQNIYWREPLWLILSLQPFVIFLIKKIVKKNDLLLYADKNLHEWTVFKHHYNLKKTLFSKNTTYLSAWLLFSLALAGPRIPLTQVDKEKFFGVNIMLVIDISRSMKATDIYPNRLRRAKVEVYELLERAQNHRIGITVFSARPHLYVPLTSDHNALATYLKHLDKLTLPTLGSDPIAAIMFAQKELRKEKRKSVMILITDGDFTTKNPLKLKNVNTPLYILGLGTTEGEAIPLENGGWLKDKQHYIISRMNEENLKQLANMLNGKYSPVYDDDKDWAVLYNQGVARHNSTSSIDKENHILWQELFPFFLLPSLFLFWFSLSEINLRIIKRNIVITFCLVLIFSIPEKSAQAFEFWQTTEQSAYQLYINKNYEQAHAAYQNIFGYNADFGQGNSLYKMGHYKKAIRKFSLAILSATNNIQRTKALYNLANSYFKTGFFSMAIETYQDVLRYQPENKAAIYNINISKILKSNIERRVKEEERIITPSRQGRGPKTIQASDQQDINDNTSVSIGDSTPNKDNFIPIPEIPNLDEFYVKKLILSGLKNIKLANESYVNSDNESKKAHLDIKLLQVQQHAYKIKNHQYELWKRLFEIEEGFPAPVDKQIKIPGIKPW